MLNVTDKEDMRARYSDLRKVHGPDMGGYKISLYRVRDISRNVQAGPFWRKEAGRAPLQALDGFEFLMPQEDKKQVVFHVPKRRRVTMALTDRARHMSPTGLNWGYAGSGPAALAWEMLNRVAGPASADRWFQRFKVACIANIPRNVDAFTDNGPFFIMREQVEEWVVWEEAHAVTWEDGADDRAEERIVGESQREVEAGEAERTAKMRRRLRRGNAGGPGEPGGDPGPGEPSVDK